MALELLRIENEPVNSNCFILFDKVVGLRCVVVDPGSENCAVIDMVLEKNKLIPEYIILTHEHFDHIWGCNYLVNKYSTRIICSKQCAFAIRDAKRNHSLFYNQKGFIISKVDILLEDVQFKFLWEGYDIYFENARGHTNAGVFFKIDHYLFTGDTLIKGIRTGTKLYTGSRSELIDTLEVIEKMKGKKMVVCPGHGECFELDTYDMKLAL